MRYDTAVAIGRGASGEVFKAWDPMAHRTVAIKVFSNQLADSAARYARETEAQRSLRHPAICEIYEVGVTEGGQDFMAMRFVDGEPLDQVAARISVRRRVDIIREIADAIGTAHARGIVHRDLKPNNLLVEEQADGTLQPFVLDFGIARVAGGTRLTEPGQLLGTPGYLSPEQARGDQDIDARSDVFGLGIVLYQALTGDLPFAANSNVVEIGWRRGLQRLRRAGTAVAREELEQVLNRARTARDQAPNGAAENLNLGNALYAWAAVVRAARGPTRPRHRP